MFVIKCSTIILLLFAACTGSESTGDNEVFRTAKSADLVSAVAEDCLTSKKPVMTCLRHKVLSFVNSLLGIQDETEGRGVSDGLMDEIIAKRLKKYFNSHEFKIKLPKFLFEEAILTFSPSKGLANFKVDFPQQPETKERPITEARGHLKKKLLLPLLLLLKLKIKALTPILLVIIGIKAVKAFIMSKISLLLVIGFMLLQLFKKGGMSMPVAMPAAMATDPPPVYGPPPTSATYGPPAPTPETSYGPWEPSNSNGNANGNGNSYARWDSHSLAYNAHQPEIPVKTAQQIQNGA